MYPSIPFLTVSPWELFLIELVAVLVAIPVVTFLFLAWRHRGER